VLLYSKIVVSQEKSILEEANVTNILFSKKCVDFFSEHNFAFIEFILLDVIFKDDDKEYEFVLL
jgi:hypothetical protein